MLIRDRILVSAVFLLLTCIFLLYTTETGYTQDGSDCCIAHLGVGCNVQQCQNAVCEADSFCCNVSWDEKCASQALDLCGSVCEGGAHPIPTFNEWGLIALAGALGLFSLLVIRRRYTLRAK